MSSGDQAVNIATSQSEGLRPELSHCRAISPFGGPLMAVILFTENLYFVIPLIKEVKYKKQKSSFKAFIRFL